MFPVCVGLFVFAPYNYQAQKAKEKEESEQFTEQLDKDFASLVQSEALLSLTQPNKMSALNALVNSRNSNDNAKEEEAPRMYNKVSTQHVHFYLKLFYSLTSSILDPMPYVCYLY